MCLRLKFTGYGKGMVINMKLQMLISAVGQDVFRLPEKMNLECDAIIINQGVPYGYEEYEYHGNHIRCFNCMEKGVGLSRNNALLRAEGEISLFADEDIVYESGYAQKVIKAFEEHPEADMLLFNVKVTEERRTYFNESFSRVRWYNCGRYPAYSFALRTEKMHELAVTYHMWFGGGARYSNGEDSLFINDCIKKGMRVYRIPVTIGEEIPRPSTWFDGYHEKFFYDRGVLYHYLYGKLAPVMAARFLLKNGNIMCQNMTRKEAWQCMKNGYRLKETENRNTD